MRKLKISCYKPLVFTNTQSFPLNSSTFVSAGISATGNTGFVRVLENLESPRILLWHFPVLESPGKRPLVLESSGNLLNSAKKYEVFVMQ